MKTNTIISCQKDRHHRNLLLLKNLGLVGRSIVNYFNEDREKLIILIMFLLFPIVLNSYLIFPDFPIAHYGTFQVLVFTISESLCHLMLAIAVYFAFNKKDTFMQILAIGAMFIIFYQLGAKLYSAHTPKAVEVISFIIIAVCLIIYIGYVKNKVIPDKLHKINHGILQNVSRIEGLAGIKMEDKDLQIALMGKEAGELKQKYKDNVELLKMEEVE